MRNEEERVKRAFIIGPQDDLADYAAFAASEGLDGVEFNFYTRDRAEFCDARARKHILDDHGVVAASVALWGIGLADPASSGSRDVIKAGLDFAAEIGATCFYSGAGEPSGDNPAAAFAESWADWQVLTAACGLALAVYLGHKGSYIMSEKRLAETVAAVPDVGLKLDPVGMIRNLKADPLYILGRYGGNLAYLHVKGLVRLADREFEPPPGMDELCWPAMFGIIHEHGYDGWVSAEPHGPYWSRGVERRKQYVRLTFKALAPFLI